MRRVAFWSSILLACLAAFARPLPAAGSAAGDWRAKVDARVLADAASGQAEFFLVLAEQADLSGAAALPTKAGKGAYVHRALVETAARTQAPLLAALAALGAPHRPFWVANMVLVTGTRETLEALASRPEVAAVRANPAVRLAEPEPAVGPWTPFAAAVEWNVARVGAPGAWALGFTGQGAVVGGQDTGYEWDHPALKAAYRGWDGAAADHDYAWHDAIHAGGGVCGADAPAPCDDYGHGTHTMGTIVGDDGANQVGVAPGARWIGCRNMSTGVGSPATYAECYQWFIAPTRVDGSDPDPARAPDVVNNSWSCTAGEGCTEPDLLRAVVESVRAAGILTVHSAGNAGPACGTVADPAAIYEASFTVGAVDAADAASPFSSRGPVSADGSGRRKPDVAAPGSGVRSSARGGGYAVMSGTSMASPHVAGAAALLVSADASLAGRPDLIEDLLEQTAVPLASAQGCGGDGPDLVPNNVYGWGRIDAHAAAVAIATTGALSVVVLPPEAAAAGAAWRVGDGPWQASGATVGALAPGEQTVSFSDLPGWKRPADLAVPVAAGEVALATGVYARQAVVSLAATDPIAAEPGANTGTFRITRFGDLTQPLAVQWRVAGSAAAAVDYRRLPARVVIPAGAASVRVRVVPFDDARWEPFESVSARLRAGAGYTVGVRAAVVWIHDDD